MAHPTRRRDFLRYLGLAGVGVALPGFERTAATQSGPRRPNVVVIFMDDMGYADPAVYGGAPGTTPNIDRLATQGMRFTNFYVAQAVCSASRAALLTGCYSNRVGVLGALGPNAATGLDPDEDTIADMLKRRGYACGIFGKWHLGDHQPYLPLQQGFDEYFGLPYSNDMWPVDYDGTPITPGQKRDPADTRQHRGYWPPLHLMEGNAQGPEIRDFSGQGSLTALYTARAVHFITAHKDEPFFLYLPHSMVHVPLGVSRRFRGKSGRGLFSDVMMEVDWSVGQVLDTLRRHGLEDDTVVIFTSDNGPWLNFGNHAGSAGPFREGKGTMWEGGCRVPAIVRWPRQVPAGTVCHRMAATIDILPTIAAITDAPLPARRIDGVNILPLLRGDQNANPRDVYWYYYGQTLTGVRQGPWKLQLPHEARTYEGHTPGWDGIPGTTGTLKVELGLYNLETDIGETINLVNEQPEIVRRLQAIAAAARADLGDTGEPGPGVRPPRKIAAKD
ncbi:MAG: sulfatase [Acidimicrobiia bacterium]|nr:sulfatase [Acidimicrobiia bacterium]